MRTEKVNPETKTQARTLTGIIIPTDWDENGTPLKVGLASDDEQIYSIDDSTVTGRELHALISQRVKLSGTIGTRGKRSKMITVSSYERHEI
jgi:hypothetical protein